MVNLKLIFASCLMFGFLGLTLPNKANAADPNPCPQFFCKNVSYWWDGDPKLIKTATVPVAGTLTVQGWANIFTPSSTFDVPNAATGSKIDIVTYSACAPHCGKDANGVWQTVQEVSPVGNFAAGPRGAVQFSCTSVNGLGPAVLNPVNGNAKAKNTPPGYVTE